MRGVIFADLAIVLAAPAVAETNQRPPAFGVCSGCHSTEPGKTVFGPSLAGVMGRKAGSLPGYPYSPALRQSGLTWDAAALNRWLSGPQNLIPGTKMPFGGYADPGQRQAVIAYLVTLRVP